MKEFKPRELFEKIDDIKVLKSLHEEYLCNKVILGIDIYRYSQYPLVEQIYIPILFHALYDATVRSVISWEKFIFKKYGLKENDFEKRFINTGDGGFQIFDNPIEAIVFALYFQTNVKRFVSGSNTVEFGKKLHKIIETIELRYAITSDLIYSYAKNYFGPGIINNARILSKDSLNRFLIDSNTMNWFINNINSVENLMDINKDSFLLTNAFKDYDKELNSGLFDSKDYFKSVDVLKIGSITAKNTSLDIYNLHIQAITQLNIDKQHYNNFVITLGNLNTSGIQ
jgi:hypothetical protein